MNTRLIVLTALAAALAACSSTPDRNAALDQSRDRYQLAQRDPQVSKLAPDEIKRAGETLRRAEKALTDGKPTADVEHLAYMAGQHVTIAQETASSLASQAITAGAAAERDKMRLRLRTEEANAAQQKLAMSQESNAQKALALAAADSAALRNEERIKRGDSRVSDLEAELEALNAKQTDRGMVVTLGDVLFNTGKSRLLPGAAQNMAKLAAFFKGNPLRTATIEGHTDSVGGSSANLDLSERRANAVRIELMNQGVPADRLSTRAYGEDNPVASNDTIAGRQMNRRVEIVFATPAETSAAK